MTHQPDEGLDVIVHQGRVLGASGRARDIWTIWLAGKKQGVRDSLEAALELAFDVAARMTSQTPSCHGYRFPVWRAGKRSVGPFGRDWPADEG